MLTSILQAAFDKAESKLKKERAELSRFDDEIEELDAAIKSKKQAVSDADLALQDVEHQIQTLQKERTAAINAVTNLEKQFPWIAEEKQYVAVLESCFEPVTEYVSPSGFSESLAVLTTLMR